MKEIINCATYADGRRIADVELPHVHEVLKSNDQFVWIGLHEPSDDILKRVQSEFGLHDLAVEDAQKAHQRPKIEIYGDSLFIVMRTAQIIRNVTLILAKLIFLLGPISLYLFGMALRSPTLLSAQDVKACLTCFVRARGLPCTLLWILL